MGRDRGREGVKPTMDLAAKRCSVCAVTRPTTEFYRDRHRRDGLMPRCRQCDKARTRAAYERDHPGCRPYRPHRHQGCTVLDCQRPHKGLGYCKLHYDRVRRHGTTDLVKRTDDAKAA